MFSVLFVWLRSKKVGVLGVWEPLKNHCLSFAPSFYHTGGIFLWKRKWGQCILVKYPWLKYEPQIFPWCWDTPLLYLVKIEFFSFFRKLNIALFSLWCSAAPKNLTQMGYVCSNAMDTVCIKLTNLTQDLSFFSCQKFLMCFKNPQNFTFWNQFLKSKNSFSEPRRVESWRPRVQMHTLVDSKEIIYDFQASLRCWVLVTGIEVPKMTKYGHWSSQKKSIILFFFVFLKDWGVPMRYG